MLLMFQSGKDFGNYYWGFSCFSYNVLGHQHPTPPATTLQQSEQNIHYPIDKSTKYNVVLSSVQPGHLFSWLYGT